MTNQSKLPEQDLEQADFESALDELEQIVEALESGEMSLAQSLERFKRGVSLSKRCHQLIDQARQSVEVLADPDNEDSAVPDENPGR